MEETLRLKGDKIQKEIDDGDAVEDGRLEKEKEVSGPYWSVKSYRMHVAATLRKPRRADDGERRYKGTLSA